MPLDDFYGWETVTSRLADQAPMWPGTRNCYHAMTYGFLAGELIRRVSGLSVHDYLEREVAGPLGCDIHIGSAESEEHRVAPILARLVEVPFDPAMPPEAIAAVTNRSMEPTLPRPGARPRSRPAMARSRPGAWPACSARSPTAEPSTACGSWARKPSPG